MPEVLRPQIVRTLAQVDVSNTGVNATVTKGMSQSVDGVRYPIPDFVGFIQSKTELTRQTVIRIIEQSGRLSDVLVNPQMFMEQAARAINFAFDQLKIDHIKYEKIANEFYQVEIFDIGEIERYLDNLVPVTQLDKTVCDYIETDSPTERAFAQACDVSAQSYAKGRCPGVGGAGALWHQAEVEAVAACTIKLTPAIHGDMAVAAGKVDFDAVGRSEGLQVAFVWGIGGVAGVLRVVIVGVVEHSPAAAPLGCRCGVGAATAVGRFHDDDVAAALDALRAGKVQGGLQAFCGVAHAPAFDQRGKAGRRNSCQHGDDGHHHHDFQQGKATRLATGGGAWLRLHGAEMGQKERHVTHGRG